MLSKELLLHYIGITFMPQTNPVVLIFELHSSTKGSELAVKLIAENWCNMVGFELPDNLDQLGIKTLYEKKKKSLGINSDSQASSLLEQAMRTNNLAEAMKIKSYFTSKARLTLLEEISDCGSAAIGIDITMEERHKISGHIQNSGHESSLAKLALEKSHRNMRIANSIKINCFSSMACILGVFHAHDLISILRSYSIEFIPCFICDPITPEQVNVLDAEYPPEIRRADGILEFSSVDSALNELRKLLLPSSVFSSFPLEEPTSLTRQLSEKSNLSFFSICSKRHRVSAIAPITNQQDEEKALVLQNTLKNGCFFQERDKRYFGFPSINMSDSNELPKQIFRFCCK